MDFEGKRSGQIPAFGDWDDANELPITQYFENARQAGLVRYAPALTTDQCDPYMTAARGSGGDVFSIDLYSTDFQKPSLRGVTAPPRKAGAVNNGQSNRRSCGCPPHVKGQQQRIKQVQVKVYDVEDVKQQPRPRTKSQQRYYNNNYNQNQKPFPKHSATAHGHPILTHRPSTVAVNVKPVDEDLYKIPPELLDGHNSKRKKMLGFISKCLVPPCNS